MNVTWVHFPLHPETPLEGISIEELFAGRDIDVQLGAFAGFQYFLQHDVRRMCRTHEAKILIRIYRPNGRRGMKAELNIG